MRFDSNPAAFEAKTAGCICGSELARDEALSPASSLPQFKNKPKHASRQGSRKECMCGVAC